MAIVHTSLQFPWPCREYKGKVRDNYIINESILASITTDRISAFDVILPNPIPGKGQILNTLSAFWFQKLESKVPVAIMAVPHPNVSIQLLCQPLPIEFVVRGYLCGHAWRLYKSGQREICGVKLPEGLRMNDPLPQPILTPTTKSQIGHDMDITENEILKSGIIDQNEWFVAKEYAFTTFQIGQEYAASRGLLLADAKYEFGLFDEQVRLMDEVHTPDSARFFVKDGFEERQNQGKIQEQYSKEFVREWLISQNFMGQEGVQAPLMSDDFVNQIVGRYAFVFETLTGENFVKNIEQPDLTIQTSIINYLNEIFNHS